MPFYNCKNLEREKIKYKILEYSVKSVIDKRYNKAAFSYVK